MTAFELSIATPELGRRMLSNLRAGALTADVVWQKKGRHVLLHTASLEVRSVEGWLLVSLDLETDQTRRATLQFVFFMGRRAEGSGNEAACTINAVTPAAAALADAWGRDLERVMWDAVLDGVEASLARMSVQLGSRPVTLGGFFTDAQSLIVSVLAEN